MCFCMYSDMSRLMRESSSPNRNSASVLASSVLPTPEGPRKMNEPLGRLGSLRPARVRRMAWRDGGDGVVLGHHPLVHLVLHAQQLLGLLLGELVHRDARPQRQHLGDGLLVDLVEEVDPGGAWPALEDARVRCQQLLLLVAQLAGVSKRWASTASFLRDDHLGQLGLELLELAAASTCASCAGATRPRRSGRWPCRAGAGRRCSGRRGSPRPPAPGR